MKKIILGLAIVVLAVSGYLFFNYNKKAESSSFGSDVILFYGIGCPHCKNVEDFLEQNQVADKIQIDQKEVYGNRENAKIFQEKAAQCGLDKKNLGVPLLWVKGKCYSGDQEIIQYFKDQLNGGQ